jgi:hypothetical protein
MGNLRQSNAGIIDAELTLPLMTLAGDLGIVGRAIVVSNQSTFISDIRSDVTLTATSLRNGSCGMPQGIACCSRNVLVNKFGHPILHENKSI